MFKDLDWAVGKNSFCNHGKNLSPVGWSCRIRRLHIHWGVKNLPSSVQDMILNNLIVRSQTWDLGNVEYSFIVSPPRSTQNRTGSNWQSLIDRSNRIIWLFKFTAHKFIWISTDTWKYLKLLNLFDLHKNKLFKIELLDPLTVRNWHLIDLFVIHKGIWMYFTGCKKKS